MSLGKSRHRSLGQGRQWMRRAALLLAVAGTAAGLAGCEYPDDVTEPTAAPTRAGRPARSAPPPADPGVANAEQRNLDDLGAVLGARPGGIVLEAFGGIGGAGLRKSVSALSEGTYTVTAACVGAPTSILISQDGLRDGGNLELTLDCGKATRAQVDLAAGPVQARAHRLTTGPGAGEVAGFWLVPAAPGS